ncbi:hypothetical protein V4890_24085 [Ralstonia solanacearum species complex bacterium KE056]|uniref:hypothetical protein n=1 Tax=Ralstonia solanacearum species complex bacterium KE056 TaxID=3119585 RepID=UPI002FC2B219
MKIKKVAIVCLAVLASAWFVPVNFLIGTYFGLSATCAVQRCTWNRGSGDPPPIHFYVMVRGDGESEEVVGVLLRDLSDHMSKNPNHSLRLNRVSGISKYGGWQYKVTSEGPDYQVIEANYQDAASISESYKVTDGIVQPLSSQIETVSYMFASIPAGILFARLIRRMAKRRLSFRKRGSRDGVQ